MEQLAEQCDFLTDLLEAALRMPRVGLLVCGGLAEVLYALGKGSNNRLVQRQCFRQSVRRACPF